MALLWSPLCMAAAGLAAAWRVAARILLKLPSVAARRSLSWKGIISPRADVMFPRPAMQKKKRWAAAAPALASIAGDGRERAHARRSGGRLLRAFARRVNKAIGL